MNPTSCQCKALLTSSRAAVAVKGIGMSLNRIGIALMLLSAISWAQETSSSDQKTIQQLVQEVRELQVKVQILESQRQTVPPPTATPQDINPATETPENTG